MIDRSLLKAFIIITILFAVIILIASLLTGDGGWRRAVTLSGVYSICRPDNYPVVCFLDSDGNDGGMYCIPLSEVGGKCL